MKRKPTATVEAPKKRLGRPPKLCVEFLGTEPAPLGEIIVNDPMRGVPQRAIRIEYRPEYCDMILKMFAEMLESTGEKLEDKLSEETRTIADRGKQTAPPAAPEPLHEDGKKAARPIVPGLQIQERRAVKRHEWRMVCAELPSMSKFGRMIGVSEVTIRRWRKLYPSFDDACEMCRDMGEDALSQRALRGQYDGEFAKFIGKNWYGMKDRHEITGADGAPINPPAEYRLIPMDALDAAHAALTATKQKLLEAGKPEETPK